MMSMIIFYVFLAAESKSAIRFASSRLDLAVPELWIFAFLLKSEKKIRAQVSYNYNLDVFYVFLDKGSEKSIRNTPSCLLLEFLLLSENFFFQNKKYDK